jgi:NAD(P)H-dependent FMN reductase
MRLAVIIGSTRSGRFGPTVAHWLAGQAAKQFDVDLIDLAAAKLPTTLLDTDDATPEEVAVLAPRLATADAFAVVTPEYNSSFPAPLKTALDWY